MTKDPLAVALGRRGGLKGARTLNARLTAAERSASASRAANARWKKIKMATHFADDFKRWAFAQQERADNAERKLAAVTAELRALRETMSNHQLPPEKVPVDPAMEVESLRHVVTELTGKIQFLVEWADGKDLLEDHAFTFPDGDIWKAQDVEPKKES